MTSKLECDTRLDPRIKAYFAGIDLGAAKPNVSSREELLAQENTREALAALQIQYAAVLRLWGDGYDSILGSTDADAGELEPCIDLQLPCPHILTNL